MIRFCTERAYGKIFSILVQLAAACVVVGAGALRAQPPALPPIVFGDVASPAGAGARNAVLATGPDGSVWMAWEAPSAPGSPEWDLRCCQFNSGSLEWRGVSLIASNRKLRPGVDELPSLTAGAKGQLFMAWSEAASATAASRVYSCASTDGGIHWATPTPASAESVNGAFPALTTLADGRVLLAWLDRRGKAETDADASVCLRFLSGPMTIAPDWLLDEHACPGAQPVLAPLVDGGAAVTYRGLTAEDIEDPRVARLHGRRWENRHAINPDGQKAAGTRPGGPSLTADGGRLAAAWRTANAGDSTILFSTSPDAGARFLAPVRVNSGGPLGRPAVALLHDGAGLVAWCEQSANSPPVAWLRRSAPEFSLNPPVLLGAVSGSDAENCIQIAIVRDFAGDVLAAQAIVACAAPGTKGGVRTLIVNIPEADLLSAANDTCHCAPTPMQLAGYSLFGTVVSVASDRRSVTIESEAVPGVLDAGVTTFLVEPSLGAMLKPGRECLARIVRKDGLWSVSEARSLEAAR